MHRDGIRNYLSDEETSESLKRAATSWKARKQLSPKNWSRTICCCSI